MDKVTSLEFAKKYSNQPIIVASNDEVNRCCNAAKAAALVEGGKDYAIPFLAPLQTAEYCSVVGNDL